MSYEEIFKNPILSFPMYGGHCRILTEILRGFYHKIPSISKISVFSCKSVKIALEIKRQIILGYIYFVDFMLQIIIGILVC